MIVESGGATAESALEVWVVAQISDLPCRLFLGGFCTDQRGRDRHAGGGDRVPTILILRVGGPRRLAPVCAAGGSRGLTPVLSGGRQRKRRRLCLWSGAKPPGPSALCCRRPALLWVLPRHGRRVVRRLNIAVRRKPNGNNQNPVFALNPDEPTLVAVFCKANRGCDLCDRDGARIKVMRTVRARGFHNTVQLCLHLPHTRTPAEQALSQHPIARPRRSPEAAAPVLISVGHSACWS